MELMGYGENAHESFDAIASAFYGKEYVGQQTGEMLSNDTYHVYEYATMDRVKDTLWEGENGEFKSTYLGFDRAAMKGIMLEGVNRLEYWLSLSHSSDPEVYTHADNPHEGEDCYGAVFKHDFQVYREGPSIGWVLADMINKGHLPLGRYLLHCTW